MASNTTFLLVLIILFEIFIFVLIVYFLFLYNIFFLNVFNYYYTFTIKYILNEFWDFVCSPQQFMHFLLKKILVIPKFNLN